jgi:hypothetical protein
MDRINFVNVTKGGRWEMGKVVVSTENDLTPQTLFEYYSDELVFSSREFIGLTLEEARALKTIKDIAYLQS